MFDAIASIAGPVIGGLMGQDAAQDAADAQTRAAAEATAEQRRQFDTTRKDQMPFLKVGQSAVMRLGDLLGLSRPGAANWDYGMPTPQGAMDLTQWAAQHGYNLPQGRDWMGSEVENLLPGYRAYLSSLPQDNSAASDPAFGSLMRDFTVSDLANDPGYAFRLNEGTKAIENAAKARGMSMSPATVKELLRYSQGFASNEFGNAFNRDMANRTTKFNFLTGTSGGGQQAAQMVGNAGANMANNIGQLVTGAANARGAAGIAGANAIGGGLAGAWNNYQSKNILDRILNRGPHPMDNYSGGYWN